MRGRASTHENVVNGDDVVRLLTPLGELLGEIVVGGAASETTSGRRIGVVLHVRSQVGSALGVVVDVLRVTVGPVAPKHRMASGVCTEKERERKRVLGRTERATIRGDGRPKWTCLAC